MLLLCGRQQSFDLMQKPMEKSPLVPIAVDAEALIPVKQVSGSCKILTLGTLHYPPNADGIRWFAGEVFPLIKERIPGVTLTIVGKNPPRDIQQFETIYPDAVRVTGYVPDLDPYFEEAALVVVPVRAGGGMRVRILEAFARGMPMVTTTVGLEGIDAEPGREVLVEDTPVEFADAVIRLLQDENLRQEIAMNGRKLIERKYDYRVVLDALQIVYQRRGNNFQPNETAAAARFNHYEDFIYLSLCPKLDPGPALPIYPALIYARAPGNTADTLVWFE
jgi:polysaccharide biosynthesis protein PslH